MRHWLFSVLLLGACSPPNQNQAEEAYALPIFTFRHMTSGVTKLDEAKSRDLVRNCKSDTDIQENIVFCDLKGEEYPDMPSMANIGLPDTFISFREGVFHGMIFEFASRDFEKMDLALRQAYGEPCRTDSKVLQNGFGAQFSGDALTWCFAGGELTASRHMESNLGNGELGYQPTLNSVAAPTYNANSL